MKIIKPVLWTVFGAVIGASAVLTADRVQAQQNPPLRQSVPTPAERLQVRPAWATERGGAFGLFFVKDSKTGGCWVAAKDGSAWASLAVAPAGTCD
jgi:hypothetical protein